MSTSPADDDAFRNFSTLMWDQNRRLQIYIDDFHAIATAENCAFIQALAGGPNRLVQIALGSSVRPELEVARLSANGLLRLIEASDLRLTASEGKAFLGSGYPPTLAEELIKRTAGWPGLLRIARSVGGFPAPDGVTASAPRTADAIMADPRIRAYFDEQIFGKLDPVQRNLLLHCSLLDLFDRALCEALMDSSPPERMLRDLAATGYLVSQCSDQPQSYTLYPPIRTFLLAKLRSYPDNWKQALRKIAADLLLARHRYREAVSQALQSEDLDFFEQLVERCGGWRLAFVEGSDVWAALADFPAARIGNRPQLQLARSYYCIQRGKPSGVRAFLDMVSAGERDGDSGARVSEDETSLFDLIRTAYEDCLLTDRQRRSLLDRVDATGRQTDIATSALIVELLAWEQLVAGEFENAITLGWQSVRLCEEGSADFVKGYALLAVGSGHLMQGNLRSAAIHFGNARLLPALETGTASEQHLAAAAFCGEIHLERGEMESAAALVEPAWAALEHIDLWSDLAFSIFRTKSICALHADGLDDALAVCEEGLERLGGRGLVRVERLTGLHMTMLAIIAGQNDKANALAVRMDVANCCEGLPPRHGLWRIRVESALVQARLLIAAREFEQAGGLLQNAEMLLGDGRASRYRIELTLCSALLSECMGETRAATTRITRAAAAAAEFNGQILPFLQAGAWLDHYLAAQTGNEEASTASRLFNQRLVQARSTRTEATTTSISTPQGLSPRETEVFLYLCRGLTNKEIASTLDLSVNTVMGYRKTMYAKLGVSTRSRLVEIATTRISEYPA